MKQIFYTTTADSLREINIYKHDDKLYLYLDEMLVDTYTYATDDWSLEDMNYLVGSADIFYDRLVEWEQGLYDDSK